MAKENIEKLNSKSNNYTAKQIQVLEGLDPVRKRPGMYIGSTGPEGLHHLIWEVVDNSIDEAMAGYAKNITVELLPDYRVKVTDDGRGIPVEKHSQTKKSALETVMTILHAGGKFGGEGYKISGGLHGVGVSVVNALSVWLRVEVKRDGKIYAQEYKRGKPITSVKTIGKCAKEETGTTVIFEPDTEIFKEIKFDFNKILAHLRQQAFLTKGIRIIVKDTRHEDEIPEKSEQENGNGQRITSYEFYFEGGIVSYIKYLNHGKTLLNPTPFYIERAVDDTIVEVALQYNDGFKELIYTFANTIHTIEGGTHLTGFKAALTRSINDYARTSGILAEKEENLTSEDIREGLTAVVSVKLRDPQFEGQTKAKLGNAEIRTIVTSVVGEALKEFFEANMQEAKIIISKCLLSAKARMAARAARETVIRKGVLEGTTLPGKLADCSSNNKEETELYIVEGDSAGGSAKQGRDRNFQAILPLRGKILNVERARLDKMLTSQEIKALIIALGTGVGEQFNIAKLRYNRIIIMTDADVDGAHIRTLLLTLFYRYFEDLITQGHIYIAQPPLFRVQYGKNIEYAYTDQDKEEIISNMEKEAKNKKAKSAEKKEKIKKEEGETADELLESKAISINIQRYKGLGEMNPVQLWDTTMDPENRMMKKVQIDDARKADETFEILMGNIVEPRKKFIQTHAKKVKNLDI